MKPEQLKQKIIDLLEDRKGKDILCLDISSLTSVADYMIIVSGTSSQHVKSLADHVATETKKLGAAAIGIEGEQAGEWVLIDHGDVITHVMLPETRKFYDLEQLWQVFPSGRDTR